MKNQTTMYVCIQFQFYFPLVNTGLKPFFPCFIVNFIFDPPHDQQRKSFRNPVPMVYHENMQHIFVQKLKC